MAEIWEMINRENDASNFTDSHVINIDEHQYQPQHELIRSSNISNEVTNMNCINMFVYMLLGIVP